VYNSDQPVIVKFISDDKLITSDRIKGNTFHKGFIKKYDVRHVTSESFQIEISDVIMSVTFRLTKADNGQNFVSAIEKITYNTLVASSGLNNE
jgi:hypothetical protein